MRSTAAQVARVVRLEQPPKPGQRSGGPVVLPRIMGVDEWEAIAEAQQQALVTATHADANGEPVQRIVAAPDRPFWHKG